MEEGKTDPTDVALTQNALGDMDGRFENLARALDERRPRGTGADAPAGQKG